MIRWFERHPKIAGTIAIFGAGLIYYLSSLTFGGGPGSGSSGIRAYLYHLTAFFLLAAFCMFATVQGKRREFFIPVILITCIYAALDEFHQYFVPGRLFSIKDILIDWWGIAFAFLSYLLVLELRQDNQPRG